LSGQNCEGPLTLTMTGAQTNQPIQIEDMTYGVYCTEGSDGSIFLNVYGGTPQYQYGWHHDSISTSFAEDLAVGSYFVTVTDANGCSEERTITLITVDPLLDSLQLTDGSNCGSCYLNDATQSYFYFEDEYIGSVVDLTNDKDMGDIQMCAEIAEEGEYIDGDPVLLRSWIVKSDSTDLSNFRFFFSGYELEDLAERAGYPNGIQLINSHNLYVRLGETSGFTDVILNYGDFTVTIFDPINKVYSIEITGIDDVIVKLLARNGVVLPIEWLAFSGEALETKNVLEWSTANETNNEGYFIEKSRNGLSFDQIGFVEGKNKEFNHYTFDDIHPFTGNNYYKLKQVDEDGKYSYSHIIRLIRKYDYEIYVLQNPFKQTLFLEIESNSKFEANISIFSINGQVVLNENRNIDNGVNSFQYDMNDLPEGNYVIRFFNKITNEFKTKKIIKI